MSQDRALAARPSARKTQTPRVTYTVELPPHPSTPRTAAAWMGAIVEARDLLALLPEAPDITARLVTAALPTTPPGSAITLIARLTGSRLLIRCIDPGHPDPGGGRNGTWAKISGPHVQDVGSAVTRDGYTRWVELIAHAEPNPGAHNERR